MARRAQGSRRATAGGLFGSAVALLCCAEVAPVIGALSALGLGFLLRDAILVPLLIVGLGVTVWGLWQGRRCHGRNGPVVAGVVGSLIAVAGALASAPLALVGLGGVIVAGIWNLAGVRACVAKASIPA